MSHITDVKLKIHDLEALREAADACGFDFREGQKTHAWYGRFMRDSAEGMEVARTRGEQNMGKCDHALRSKDHQAGDYEVGVVREDDGSYLLSFDSWGPGRKLEAAAGAGLSKLKREYAAATAMKKARTTLGRHGFTVSRENLPGNRIRVRARKR